MIYVTLTGMGFCIIIPYEFLLYMFPPLENFYIFITPFLQKLNIWTLSRLMLLYEIIRMLLYLMFINVIFSFFFDRIWPKMVKLLVKKKFILKIPYIGRVLLSSQDYYIKKKETILQEKYTACIYVEPVIRFGFFKAKANTFIALV